MTTLWTDQWRELEFRVELRSLGSSRGSTLFIGPVGDHGPDGHSGPDGQSRPASVKGFVNHTDRADDESDGTQPNPARSTRPTRLTQWLRFDCFDNDPHWHIDPTGRDEKNALTDLGDSVSEVFEMLHRELPKLLEQAGAPAEIVLGVAQPEGDAERRAFLQNAESAMRHRPIDFEEIDIRTLQHRRSAKWRFHPQDILPAWVAEMDFPIAAPIQEEMLRLTMLGDCGYPLGDQETGLPEAFRLRMQERFGWNPDPTRVELLSEVVQGLYIALEAYCGPGEGAVVQTPIYPPFLNAVHDTGRRLVENPLVMSQGRLEFDLEALSTRIDAETRVLLLCNPHNPSGRVMEREELNRLAGFALEHDLIVVSDEIHADLIYDGRQHIPFASLGDEIERRTVTITSASKAFNIPGLRCAIAHFGSEELHRRFNALHPPRVRGGIGLLGIYATIAAWRWGQPWLDEVVAYLQSNRDYVKQALGERIPEIGFISPESTYLAWLDCGALDIKGSPAGYFMRHGKVALTGGRRFGAAWEQHARLNFATSRPILAESIDRMAKALGR